MSAPRVFTGPRAFFYLRGRRVAYASNVTVRESISEVPINILGDVHAQRHETTQVTVGGSFGYFCMLQEPLSKLVGADGKPLWPTNVGQGLNSSDASDRFVEFPDMDMLLEDKISRRPVLRVFGVKPLDRSWTVSTGGIAMVDASFVGTRMLELGISEAELNANNPFA